MKKNLLFIIGGISIMLVSSCNSNSKQSQESVDYYSSSETDYSDYNDETYDLSNNYYRIENLCDRIQEEEESFVERTDYNDARSKFISAYCALTDAYHHAHRIKTSLIGIRQGDKVIARLQDIDNDCYSNENTCQEGIDELNSDNGYLPSGMGDAWIAVLNRIKKYSSEIRGQVQIIRDAQ